MVHFAAHASELNVSFLKMDILAILKQALEWLKKPIHYSFPVFLISGFGLCVPIKFLEILGIESWRSNGKPYLGSLFVISSVVILCHFTGIFANWCVQEYKYRISLRRGLASLKALTIEEQDVLAGYLRKNSKTQMLNPASGVVTGLTNANIIYASASYSDHHLFPFNIKNWAWIYINKYPYLVGLKRKHKENE